MKRGDIVVARTVPRGPVGLVRRVSKKDNWVDVIWRTKSETWSKRMRISAVELVGVKLA